MLSFFSSKKVSTGALTSALLSYDDKSFQLASLEKGFYLLLQVKAVVGVVAIVPMKTTVLIMYSLLRRGTDPFGPLDAQVIPNVHEHLFRRCIKMGIAWKPTWGEIDLWSDPVVVVAFFHLAASIFLRWLLLFPLSLVEL